jgi:transcriptional regulator with XRE-family HTH domain
MKLAAYLKDTDQTYRQFAAKLGCDAAQVNRWANGRRSPTLEMCARIRAATGGRVSADDFLPDECLPRGDGQVAA